jgi:phosphoglycerate dehydrogenase-like enzyme
MSRATGRAYRHVLELLEACPMKVLLPTSIPLSPELPEGVRPVPYAPAEPIPAGAEDAEVLVAWGNTDAQLADAARRLRALRLVQSLAAGPDQVLRAGFPPDVLVCSGRSLHDHPVAEHTLALVLAAARGLHRMVRAQIGHRWAGELGGVQPLTTPGRLTTLRGAHVLIWGFGSIATTLAPLLTALGARVTGVARSAGERAGYPVVAAGDLAAELPRTDLLVMLVPATPENRHALDARLLALLPAHAWLVNAGRGATVDTDALLEALRAGRLGGAALDVFETEPLPVDSPLWDRPDVIVSPHAAGGRPLGADALVAENVRALLAGTPLRNRVER